MSQLFMTVDRLALLPLVLQTVAALDVIILCFFGIIAIGFFLLLIQYPILFVLFIIFRLKMTLFAARII
jgi:hypothetical protein